MVPLLASARGKERKEEFRVAEFLGGGKLLVWASPFREDATAKGEPCLEGFESSHCLDGAEVKNVR